MLKFEQTAMTILWPLGCTCASIHYMVLAPVVHSMQIDLYGRRTLPEGATVVHNSSRDAHLLVEPQRVGDVLALRIRWPLRRDRSPSQER